MPASMRQPGAEMRQVSHFATADAGRDSPRKQFAVLFPCLGSHEHKPTGEDRGKLYKIWREGHRTTCRRARVTPI
jgi:hypothetical protein